MSSPGECDVKSSLAYEVYKQLCLQANIEPSNPAIFGKRLFDLFPLCEKTRRRVSGRANIFEYPLVYFSYILMP